MEPEELERRLDAVRDRIAAAARRCGRTPDKVRLVLASKTQPAAAVRAAYRAGARDFGENYVQEALAKQTELSDLKDIRWHLIGHLQTNKARVAAAAFDLIESLDSVRLGEALSRYQRKAPGPPNARVAVLLEVNLGHEASKTGVSPADTETLIHALMGKVDVRGTHGDSAAGTRPRALPPLLRAVARFARPACRRHRTCAKRAVHGND